MNLVFPELRDWLSQIGGSAPHLEMSFVSQPGRAVKGINIKREKVEVLIPEQFLVAFLLFIFLSTALYLFGDACINKGKPPNSRTGKSGVQMVQR